MNEFDIKAAGWDANDMNVDRARKVAEEILDTIPLSDEMNAMEFGAGTGLLSFLLRDHLNEITLIETSAGMEKVLKEKLDATSAENMKLLCLDLENDEYHAEKFDFIYMLMALHHVTDVEKIIKKFHDMLKGRGYLAIADLYSEDGSFHGSGFTGHRGFDTDSLSALLEKSGFTNIRHRKVYVIDKMTSDNSRKLFEVFLMTATSGA